MKIFKSLLFRLILAIVVGAIVGLFCRERVDLTAWFMQVIVCIHRLLGQFVSFCVPLVILGCVGPAITKLGNNVGKLLSVALIIAYTSTQISLPCPYHVRTFQVPQQGSTSDITLSKS